MSRLTHIGVVDVCPMLAEALAALPHRRGPVVRRLDGQAGPNRATRLSQLANAHLRDCGITDTLHALRHRFVTQVYRAGGIRAAQESAGHASISSTAIYSAVARREIRAAVLAAGRIAS